MGGLDKVFGSDNEDGGIDGALASANTKSQVSWNTSYPGAAEGDPILWLRWETSNSLLARRLLFLGYSEGLQI